MIWHSASSQQVMEELGSNGYKGLTGGEAESRLRQYGQNVLRDQKRKSLPGLILEELKSPSLLMVVAAAVIWLITGLLIPGGNLYGPLMILLICLVGVAIDVAKEAVAQRSLDTLRSKTGYTAKVLRDGEEQEISARRLVPGDILFLEEGDYIPADARLIKSEQLRCDESTLMGEPVPVEKAAEDTLADIVPIEKRTNMVYAGCTVSHGTAKAVVIATGMNTESAKIALVVEDSLQITTPLQAGWKATAGRIGTAAAVVGGVIFVLGLIFSDGSFFQRLADTFVTCAALAAAAVPASLAATITALLAVGVSRMVHHKLLVRSLSAVETLGKVSVICTDKTGTLTQNHMTMTRLYAGKEILNITEDTLLQKPLKDLLMMGAMCCDADVQMENGQERLIGDHTEAGMVAAAQNYAGIDKQTLDSMYPRLCVLPFDADRKLKTSVNMIDGKPVAVVKGAPDIIISRCNHCDQKGAVEAARMMAGDALRVIGIAFKALEEAPTNPTQEELEHDLIFGGLVGLEDPPIPEAAAAIEDARTAGIKVVMMTGDHVSTAVSSAKGLGLMDEDTSVITNDELDSLTEEELDELIGRFGVYVRLSPENKQRVVASLQRVGYVVAVTGDRVEDGPVLRAADVGCAMGDSGTDVAKGAADVIVDDDNFVTIMDGISAGRGIYQNICKAIRVTLGFVLGLGLVMLLGLIGWGEMPLNAVQIMWLNLMVSAASVLPVGLERPAKGLMNMPPRTDDRILDQKSGLVALLHGGLLAVATLVGFGIGGSPVGFGVLAFGQLLCGFSARSPYPLLAIKRLRFNYWLVGATLLGMGLTLLFYHIPLFSGVLGLTALLDKSQKIWLAVLSLLPFLCLEGVKLIRMIKKGKKEQGK